MDNQYKNQYKNLIIWINVKFLPITSKKKKKYKMKLTESNCLSLIKYAIILG